MRHQDMSDSARQRFFVSFTVKTQLVGSAVVLMNPINLTHGPWMAGVRVTTHN